MTETAKQVEVRIIVEPISRYNEKVYARLPGREAGAFTCWSDGLPEAIFTVMDKCAKDLQRSVEEINFRISSAEGLES